MQKRYNPFNIISPFIDQFWIICYLLIFWRPNIFDICLHFFDIYLCVFFMMCNCLEKYDDIIYLPTYQICFFHDNKCLIDVAWLPFLNQNMLFFPLFRLFFQICEGQRVGHICLITSFVISSKMQKIARENISTCTNDRIIFLTKVLCMLLVVATL